MRSARTLVSRFPSNRWITSERVLAAGLFCIAPIVASDSLGVKEYVLGALVLLAVFLFRSHPVAGLGIVALACLPYFLTEVAASPVFYAVFILVGLCYREALPGRRWVAIITPIMMFGMAWRQMGYIDQYDAVSVLGPLVAAIAIGSASRRRQLRLEAERAEHAEELQAVRVIMASELHDSVAQTQSLVMMRLEDALWDHWVPDGLREDLEDVLALSRRAATELRTALGTLHSMDDRFTTLGLPATITLGYTWKKSLAALQAAGFEVQARYALGAKRFDPAREHALARTVEELTSNVLWHGAPGPCVVSVALQDGDAIVHVENDIGPVEARRAKAGTGLLGVKERIRLLAGECDFRPYGERWVARVRLPMGTQLNPRSPNSQLPVLAS